jgi:hypothetical protein
MFGSEYTTAVDVVCFTGLCLSEAPALTPAGTPFHVINDLYGRPHRYNLWISLHLEQTCPSRCKFRWAVATPGDATTRDRRRGAPAAVAVPSTQRG